MKDTINKGIANPHTQPQRIANPLERGRLILIGVCIFAILSPIFSYGQIGIFSTPIETVSQERINEFFTIETWHSFDLFLGNKEYALTYTSGADGMFEVASFSFGTYCKNDKGFVLKDLPNGYTMTVEYVNDSSLVFTKGLYCMKSRTLIRKSWDQELYDDVKTLGFDYEQDRKECRRYKHQQNASGCLAGNYGYDVFCEDNFFPLILSKDGSFELSYRSGNLMVSKGTWSREGNLLILQDENLDEPFYALIEEDVIISHYLMGDIKGKKLYKQK